MIRLTSVRTLGVNIFHTYHALSNDDIDSLLLKLNEKHIGSSIIILDTGLVYVLNHDGSSLKWYRM